jgi:hypothetical protein
VYKSKRKIVILGRKRAPHSLVLFRLLFDVADLLGYRLQCVLVVLICCLEFCISLGYIQTSGESNSSPCCFFNWACDAISTIDGRRCE